MCRRSRDPVRDGSSARTLLSSCLFSSINSDRYRAMHQSKDLVKYGTFSRSSRRVDLKPREIRHFLPGPPSGWTWVLLAGGPGSSSLVDLGPPAGWTSNPVKYSVFDRSSLLVDLGPPRWWTWVLLAGGPGSSLLVDLGPPAGWTSNPVKIQHFLPVHQRAGVGSCTSSCDSCDFRGRSGRVAKK